MIFDFYTLILIISTKIMGIDFVTHTAKFSGETVERAIERAIVSKLNIVVEGTFRNAATPLQTLKKLKDAGYQTEVMIKTTSAALSWESTNERYNKDKEAGNIARKVDKNHHDIVTVCWQKMPARCLLQTWQISLRCIRVRR